VGADGAVIDLVTRCSSAQEFIERFARFTTETHVIVPALPHLSVGSGGPFAIRLKDKTVMMQGRCEVTEIRPVPIAPGETAAALPRAVMSLRLIEMDAHSCGVHLRLMEGRAAASKPPAAAPPRRTTPARSLSLVPPHRAEAAPAAEPRSEERVAPAAAPPPPPASTIQVMSLPRPPPLRGAPGPGFTGAPAAHAAPRTHAAPAAHAAAMTSLAVAQSPPETRTVEITSPNPEARVAGAAFTLPANPLSDLDVADLSALVDLTLLETNAAAGAPIGTGETDAAGVAAIGGEAARAGTRAEPARSLLPRPAPAPRSKLGLDDARRIARRAAPYAAVLFVGVLLGIALKPGSKVRVVDRPTLVPPPAAAPPAATSKPAEVTGTAAPRDCVAQVTTTPAGAVVFWGELSLGLSPIERAAVPCGPATVTFRRERYAEETRTIAVEPGRSAVVAERLHRPPAKIVVTSSPPHAIIKLNRHLLGPAPRKLSTLRFEHVRIEATLPGYRPWKKTVYLKEAESKIDVTLVPVPRPPARRPR
jgi:hypothetical protein